MVTDAAGDGLAERGAAIFAQLRSTLTEHEDDETSDAPASEPEVVVERPSNGESGTEGPDSDRSDAEASSEAGPGLVDALRRELTSSPDLTDGAPDAEAPRHELAPEAAAPSVPAVPEDPPASSGTAESPVTEEISTAVPDGDEVAGFVSEPAPMARPLPSDLPPHDSRETSDVEADAAEASPTAPRSAARPDPTRFSRPLPRVIAIANQKGGVGKTTTSVNLSACLAEQGHRVLVVDLDPQGNATTGLGINPRNLQYSLYEVLLQDRPLEDCIEPTSVRNLFVAPSSLDLAGAEIELVPVFSRELKLRRAIESVLDDYDYVLIDCPPSLGLLTVNGMAAAAEVIVPIQCEYYALEGLGQLLRNVNLVQANLNPRLEVLAVVLVMYDARTRLSGEVAREVREHFGDRVARTVVPRTVRLSEAPSFGQPIIAFDPSSRGALAYRDLAKEIHGGQT